MTDHNSPPAGAGAGAAQDNPQLSLGTFTEDATRSESSEGATDEDSSKQYRSLRESIRMEEIKKLQQQLKSIRFIPDHSAENGEGEGDFELGAKKLRSASSFEAKTSTASNQPWKEVHRNSSLPNYDYLLRDAPPQTTSIVPKTSWWHWVFVFSVVSFLACVITLWAPYPFGARMPSEQVADMPWSDGCEGTETCICPRETICADSMPSMVFLTIARCTAWFDYPLYMVRSHSDSMRIHELFMTCLWLKKGFLTIKHTICAPPFYCTASFLEQGAQSQQLPSEDAASSLDRLF